MEKDHQKKGSLPGVRYITLSSGYRVWTQKLGSGNHKVLMLHGGPGCTHEYLEKLAEDLSHHNIEVYLYDQLGSWHSDQPDDPSLWTLERFISEIEEVRLSLGLENFYLYGQSCGGLWAIEYALTYSQTALKGLILSNITGSIESYIKHINELREQLPSEDVEYMKSIEAKENFDDERYQSLLSAGLYQKHICRLDPWPDALQRAFSHMNEQVYNTMQGNNEFVFTGNLKDWNRWDNLDNINVPTLIVAGRYDTMRPSDQHRMSSLIPKSQVVICENGSHCCMWDDADTYLQALLSFIEQQHSKENA